MKHFIYLFLFAILLLPAQAQTFNPGDSYFSAGAGSRSVLASVIDNDISIGSTLNGQTGPFNFNYEYCKNPHFGIGIHIAYEYTSITYEQWDPLYIGYFLVNSSFENWNAIIRFNYHPFTLNKFDPYFGLGAGPRFQFAHGMSTDDIPRLYNGVVPDYVSADLVFGARYFILPAFSIYAEFGISKSPIQAGIAFAPGNTKKGLARTRMITPMPGS